MEKILIQIWKARRKFGTLNQGFLFQFHNLMKKMNTFLTKTVMMERNWKRLKLKIRIKMNKVVLVLMLRILRVWDII